MKVKKISFPTPLEYIENIDDDNIDVFVELDDEYTYVFVVATYKNIGSQMNEAIDNPLISPCFKIVTKDNSRIKFSNLISLLTLIFL